MLAAAFQFSPAPADVPANLAVVEAALLAAFERDIKIVGLPEMWPTSFAFGDPERALLESERALEHICALSRRFGMVIAGSALARSTGELHYNAAHIIDGGRVAASYAKTHLFLPTREDSSFAAGSKFPEIVETSAGRISTVICYDIRFPEISRGALLESADLVIVPAQWAAERAPQFRALLCGRAVENQCAFMGINRTGAETGPLGTPIQFPGRSLIADAFGGVLAEGGEREELVVADIDFDRQRALRRMIPCAKTRRTDLYR